MDTNNENSTPYVTVGSNTRRLEQAKNGFWLRWLPTVLHEPYYYIYTRMALLVGSLNQQSRRSFGYNFFVLIIITTIRGR